MLAGMSSTGFAVQTSVGSWINRSVAVSGNGISVINGDGVSGNPTFSLSIGTGSTQVAAGNHNHDHATLTNLNSTSYTHLSAVNATDLTDAGDTDLHYHSSDRNRANHTGSQAISTVTGLQTALDGKSPTSHNHSGVYSPVGHAHTTTEIEAFLKISLSSVPLYFSMS